MATNVCPSVAQAIQFLAAHARIIRVVHGWMGTIHPVSVGFMKPSIYPSPVRATILFSTSLPWYDMERPPEVTVMDRKI